MAEKKEFIGVKISHELRQKIKKHAAEEYDGNESMTVKQILQKFFAKKVKQ